MIDYTFYQLIVFALAALASAGAIVAVIITIHESTVSEDSL